MVFPVIEGVLRFVLALFSYNSMGTAVHDKYFTLKSSTNEKYIHLQTVKAPIIFTLRSSQ